MQKILGSASRLQKMWLNIVMIMQLFWEMTRSMQEKNWLSQSYFLTFGFMCAAMNDVVKAAQLAIYPPAFSL